MKRTKKKVKKKPRAKTAKVKGKKKVIRRASKKSGKRPTKRAPAKRTTLKRGAELKALEFLKDCWPGDDTAEVRSAFATLEAALGTKDRRTAKERIASQWPPPEIKTGFFDPLDSLRHILLSQDLLFLRRQITYHIAAAAELPKVWADIEQVKLAFSMLLGHIVRRAARGSRIDIELKTFSLRGRPGVGISLANIDPHLNNIDPEKFFSDLFTKSADESSGIALADCRQIFVKQGGQLWADLPKPGHPVYHLVLPATEEAAKTPIAAHQTFKYDIAISNYANVRKRFGIKKSLSLVTRIEHYIRSLVRYPIDMVMAVSEKGIITTIYDTHEGAEQSVASRISQRLGKEEFHIGKRPVELSFKYQLTPLPSSLASSEDSKRSKS